MSENTKIVDIDKSFITAIFWDSCLTQVHFSGAKSNPGPIFWSKVYNPFIFFVFTGPEAVGLHEDSSDVGAFDETASVRQITCTQCKTLYFMIHL